MIRSDTVVGTVHSVPTRRANRDRAVHSRGRQRDLDDLHRRFADRDHAAIASRHVLPGVTGHDRAQTHPDQLAADIR
jgi:hypothetical protein